jgi:hypothetical protein
MSARRRGKLLMPFGRDQSRSRSRLTVTVLALRTAHQAASNQESEPGHDAGPEEDESGLEDVFTIQ